MKRQRTKLAGAGSRVSGVLFLAAVFAAGANAFAQEGPIVLGRQERPPPLTLDPFSVSTSLTAIVQYDSTKTNGSSTTSSAELFQESINIATGGGIVSKNFFNWSASGSFGLQENWSQHSSGENTSGLGIAYGYNLQADLLRTTLYPVNVHARRAENYTALSFQPLLKTTSTDYGATFSYRSPKIPTSLTIYHTETEQEQLDGAPTFKLTEDHLLFETSYDPTERQHLNLQYEFVAVGQENPGAMLRDYTTQNLNVSHDWQLDSNAKYHLTSTLNYNSQTGDFPFDHLRLNEQLRMRHSDYFETAVNYAFDQQEFETSLARSHQLSANFTHRLYESLTTGGQIGGSTTTRDLSATASSPSSSSQTDNVFANLAMNYTKKVPMGIFGANASIGYNQTNNGEVGVVQQVVNESQTFVDPQPIVLIRPNINPTTVVVRNAAGTRQYIEGIDYTVSESANTVQIERIPFTSNIAPNETVLLDYQIDPLPAFTLASTLLSLGVRYDFTDGILKNLGLYTQYNRQNQSTDSDQIVPDDVSENIFGVDYRIWKFTFHAEHNNHSSTLNDYVSTRVSARYTDRISPRSVLTITAGQSWNDFPTSGNSTDLTVVDGHLTYQISRELRAIVSARWRNNEDSRNGTTMGFEEQGELRWDIRQTQIFFLIRHYSVFSDVSESMGITAQFGITRSF